MRSTQSAVHATRNTEHATRNTRPWLPLAFLVLPSLILYWPFLFGGKTLFWGTALLQFWPWRRFAVQELLAGRLPLWDPYAGSGVPLLADHQSAIFYPLNVLYLALPVERAMGLSLAVHAVLAALAMYALVREWGVSRLGGVVAGLAFSLSGYMVSRGSFLTEISALPWLPLMWLYGGRIVRGRETPRAVPANALALALVVAVQFLAGHAQTWFYSLVSLALYGLWETIRSNRTAFRRSRASAPSPDSPADLQPGRSSPLPYVLLLAAVIWGVALAAIQFLPTLELSVLARRQEGAGWDEYALQYSMWPWRLITLLLPDFFGNPARGTYWGYATYWEDAGYVGVLPFLLAAWAVIVWVRRRRSGRPVEAAPPGSRRPVPFFALLALFSLLMALGRNTPLYMLFYRYVPGFGSFQAPARWLGVYTAATAALAGIGFDALGASRTERSRTLRSRRWIVLCRLGVAGGVSVALTALLGRAYLPGAMVTFAGALVRFAALWIGAMLVVLWRKGAIGESRPRLWRQRRVGWMAAVVLLVAADLVWAGYGLNPAIDAALYAPQTATGAALSADGPQGRTFISAGDLDEVLYGRYLDFGDYRGIPSAGAASAVEHWWGLREALLPDLGMVERLPGANTFEPLIEARTRALLEAVNGMPRPLAERTLGAMNVAYVLDPAPDLGAEVVHRSPAMTVTRNPRLLPRAYVVYQARPAASPDQALSLLSSPDFDPTREVILESPYPSILQSSTLPIAPSSHPPSLLPSPPNQVTIRAVLPQPGLLVLSDTAYPGWRATVDGRATEVYRANYAYRAVILDAGAHEVVFRYRPLSFRAGALISACAGIAALWVAIHGRNRHEERKEHP